VFQWSGDFDFTNFREVADFPNYRFSVLEGQENPTGLVWRIRYDFSDLEWLTLLVDRQIKKNGAGGIAAYVDADFWYLTVGLRKTFPDAHCTGPVRNGRLMGLTTAQAHLGNFPPLNDNGFRAGDGWQFFGQMFDGPEPLDMPWALDVGCVRCSYSKQKISWPRIQTHRYVENGNTGEIYWSTDPETRVVETADLVEECHVMIQEELNGFYWPGDAADPGIELPCAPRLAVWNHWPTVVSNAIGTPFHLLLSSYRAIDPDVAWFRGWAKPGGGQSVNNCHLDQFDVIVLEGPRRQWQGNAGGGGAMDGLRDWLDLGGKTLFVTNPWATISPVGSEWPTGDPTGVLGAVGASMSIVEPLTLGGPPFPSNAALINLREKWRYTDHALAPGTATFYSRLHAQGNATEITFAADGIVRGQVSGGDVVANAVLMRSGGEDPFPIIAAETLANGSRVVLSALMLWGDGTNIFEPPGYTPKATVMPLNLVNAALAGL
tara:strand:+ start:3408 stop:4877 length:1470 start_codon:yes stop_codon:yes gene_type:complete